MKDLTFKFLKTHQGVTAFARVTVQFVVQPDADTLKAKCDLLKSRDGKKTSLSDYESDWINAAFQGVKKCIEYINQSKSKVLSGTVILKKVEGLLVDTKNDACECAGILGTHLLLLPKQKLPKVSDSPPWKILFD